MVEGESMLNFYLGFSQIATRQVVYIPSLLKKDNVHVRSTNFIVINFKVLHID